jgi:hypothetical protein
VAATYTLKLGALVPSGKVAQEHEIPSYLSKLRIENTAKTVRAVVAGIIAGGQKLWGVPELAARRAENDLSNACKNPMRHECDPSALEAVVNLWAPPNLQALSHAERNAWLAVRQATYRVLNVTPS